MTACYCEHLCLDAWLTTAFWIFHVRKKKVHATHHQESTFVPGSVTKKSFGMWLDGIGSSFPSHTCRNALILNTRVPSARVWGVVLDRCDKWVDENFGWDSPRTRMCWGWEMLRRPPGTVDCVANKITARARSHSMKYFHHQDGENYFPLFLKWKHFQVWVPKDVMCPCYLLFRIVQEEGLKYEGKRSLVCLLQELPLGGGLCLCYSKNMSLCASGQLCNAPSRGEIPSSPQLVNSYALEPRTDMPCNFLT